MRGLLLLLLFIFHLSATNAVIYPFLDRILGEDQNYDDLFSMIRRNQSMEVSNLSPSYLHLLNKTMDSFLDNFTTISIELKLELDRENHWAKEKEVQGEQEVREEDDNNVDTATGVSDVVQYQYNQSKSEIERVVNDVLGSHKKARALASDAIEAFHEFKNQHIQYAVKAEESIQKEIVEKVHGESADRASEEEDSLQDVINANSGKIQPTLLESQTWKDAGFIAVDLPSISSNIAKRVIGSITLESFRLRDDTKKDIMVLSNANRLEARTRKHIGVRDWANNFGAGIDPALFGNTDNVDSNAIFYLNLAALPSIAAIIKKLELQKTGLDDILKGPKSPASLIETMLVKVNSSDTFETMSDLAFRTAALETEAMVKGIVKMVNEVKQWLKMDLLKYKSQKKIRVMQENFHSHTRIARKSNISKQSTVYERNELNAAFSSMTQVMEATSKLLGDANSTAREVAMLVNRVNFETMEEISRIHSDTELERTQEHFSLEKIKVAGEEAQKSMRIIIEGLFCHTIRAATYVLSESDGRRQVLLFICLSTTLLFAIHVGKEGAELLFSTVVERLSMPRLVREWGHGQSLNIKVTAQIIRRGLVHGEREQKQLLDLFNIFKVGIFRNAPLRNVLLIGKSGTGKSMTAKAIAEASGLPYAIMSGSDIAPLCNLGPSELRRLLIWAESRRHGGILIIDEAESALGKRLRTSNASFSRSDKDNKARSDSSAARDALNVFLSMTGETGGKIMLILTTSKPSALDEAVLDRCDEIIHCNLPSEMERREIISLELDKRFAQNTTMTKKEHSFRSWLTPSRELYIAHDFAIAVAVDDLSGTMTRGFSGRELATIVRAVATAVYGSDECLLTEKLWNNAVSDICISIKSKKMLKERAPSED